MFAAAFVAAAVVGAVSRHPQRAAHAGNQIRAAGASALSELLNTNTTLTTVYVGGGGVHALQLFVSQVNFVYVFLFLFCAWRFMLFLSSLRY